MVRRRTLLRVSSQTNRAWPMATARAVRSAGNIDVVPLPWPGDGSGPDADADLICRRVAATGLAVKGGGDLAVHAVGHILSSTQSPPGIQPSGTADDFVRAIGIPADSAAARIIGCEPPRPVDTGGTKGRPLLNVAPIGFGAHLARVHAAMTTSRLGMPGRAIAVQRRVAQSFSASITQDARVRRLRTSQAWAGNGRYCDGGAASPVDDGRLDFHSLKPDRWWRLMTPLPSPVRGTRRRWVGVRSFRARRVAMRASRPRPGNAGRESVTTTSAGFAVRPDAIRVHAPAFILPFRSSSF